MNFGAYGWMMLAGIAITAMLWFRAGRQDPRLPLIFFAALLGALVGAKVVYLLAEGWHDLGKPDLWRRWATGKSILGGLLFGYAGVELAKSQLGYTQATGDRFALVAPLGIGFGRVGCWLHGCCPGTICEPAWYTVKDAAGVPRWPAVPLELGFNAAALLILGFLRWRGVGRGQLFHVYLIAYGIFRFAHEFLRDTPRLIGPLSGYALAALAVAGLGFWGYRRRMKRGS